MLNWPSEYRAPGTHSGLNHSWIAVGMIGGAVIGGVSQNMTNKNNAKISKDAGKVDITTTRTGAPEADPYRDAGMRAAYNALFPGKPLPVPNTDAYPQTMPPDRGGPGDRGEAGVPDQYNPIMSPSTSGKGGKGGKATTWTNAKGQTVSMSGGKKTVSKGIKGPATPDGGTTAPAPFKGMSGETDEIRGRMMDLPDKNAGMYDAVEDYSTGLLRGETTNPLIGRATSAADDISADPGLAEYIAALKGNATGGGGVKGGSNVRYGYSGSYAPGGGAITPANQKSATGADEAIRKMLLGEMTPGMQANEDAISARVANERAANIRDLRARAVGSGFYGGSVYSDLESGAIAKGDQELAAELASARYGAYQNALQSGTTYDLGMAGIAADERNSSRASAAAGAGAAADAASREKLANLQMWGDALGMGMQGRTSRAGALGDLAGLTSQDQRSAAEGVNALGASRRNDLGAAGELSLGADSNRNAFRASENDLAGVRAGVNLGRSRLAFDERRFDDPLERTGTYASILNQFYGGLGSETTKGMDKRNQSPAAYGSVGGAALSGAAIGGSTASSFRG